MTQQRVFTIYKRGDGRFESRNEHPKDSPLGVDFSLSQAIGTCKREATPVSRAERVRVSIRLQDGKQAKEVDHVDPPHR